MGIIHNKKGLSGIIIAGIFIVIILGLIFTGVIVANKQGWFKKQPKEEAIPMIELYLRANELGNEAKYVPAYVQIDWMKDGANYVGYKSDIVADAYTPFLVPADRIVTVRCQGDDEGEYYLVTAFKEHNSRELEVNKSKMDCTMAKIGTLEVKKVSGNLNFNQNQIVLNVTARDGWFYKLSMCFAWSAGIIDVSNKNQWTECDSGKWLNYSKYYAENQTYEWLPEGVFRCGDVEENCQEVKGNKCRLTDAVAPYRFSGKVDSCFYTGETLAPNESYQLILDVSTIENKNPLDYVHIWFYDMDRRYDPQEDRWIWISATPEALEKFGADDVEYEIPYVEETQQ